MPIDLNPTSLARRQTAHGLHGVVPRDLHSLLFFSVVGVTLHGLAAFGGYATEGVSCAGLLLVVAAPGLAAAAAVCVASLRERPVDRA